MHNKTYGSRLTSFWAGIIGLGLLFVSVHSLAEAAHVSIPTSLLPADRQTHWDPGLNSVGGIPNRTTVCATINASTYGNGSQNAANGINSALSSCPSGQVVMLSAGNFLMNNSITIPSNVTLRGAAPCIPTASGRTCTGATRIIKGNIPGQNVRVEIGSGASPSGPSTNLTANGAKGATSVTVASNAGLAIGEFVLIDELTDSNLTKWGECSSPSDSCRSWFTRNNRNITQIVEITGINGNTISFQPQLHIAFRTAFTAQMTQFSSAHTKFAGLENLTVEAATCPTNDCYNLIVMEGCAYCWAKNIEGYKSINGAIVLMYAFRSVVRDSAFTATQVPSPGGAGYSIQVDQASSDNLIENNISWNFNKVMVMRSAGGGNVIAYNYMEDGWIEYNTNWVETGLNAAHMTGTHYVLFEGNQAFNFDSDNTWGSAIYVLGFRNHLTGKRRSIAPLNLNDIGPRRAIGVMEGHWWYTFVGNVLGTAGQDPSPHSGPYIYERTDPPWDDNPINMWQLGYNPANWSQGPSNCADCAKVLTTLVRGGNWDYATNSVHWENIPEQPVPNSFYLASKPSFFGANPWPWVDPTGATKVYTLPARQRFDSMQGAGVPPSAPTGLIVR